MATDDQHQAFLPLAEVAERVHVSVSTVRRRIRDDGLPVVRLGPSQRHPLRVPERELERWVFSAHGTATPKEKMT